MDCKNDFHRIRVVKDRGDIYYTICVNCGERKSWKRNLNAIEDLAWIKNFKAKSGYTKIPLLGMNFYRDIPATN